MYASLLVMASMTAGASAPAHPCSGWMVWGSACYCFAPVCPPICPPVCFGCYGCSCFGGYGCGCGCYGCSCFGGYGCGCYGCSCYSCYGCYSCFCFDCYGADCFACTGCYSYAPVIYDYCPVVTAPAAAAPAAGSAQAQQGQPGQQTQSPALEQTLTQITKSLQKLEDRMDAMEKAMRRLPPMDLPPGGQKQKLEELRHEEPLAAPQDLSRRALVHVALPADARLYVEGQLTPATGTDTRSIITPDLEPGGRYFYELRVESMDNGTLVRQERRVALRAGQEVRVSFDNPGQAEAAVVTAGGR